MKADRAYRKWVAGLPCVLTGSTPSDPAHIRYGFYGMALKPDDSLILPLRHDLHMLQHQIGEVTFWKTNITDHCLMEALKALAEKIRGTYGER